ncbi:hypothetical protein CapIbe_011170 [Capra ibex]
MPSGAMVNCLPAIQKTWVRSLGWEDPLEKEMATDSSTLAWKIPWMEEPDGDEEDSRRNFTFPSLFKLELIVGIIN